MVAQPDHLREYDMLEFQLNMAKTLWRNTLERIDSEYKTLAMHETRIGMANDAIVKYVERQDKL